MKQKKLIIAIVVLAVLVAAGYFVYNKYLSKEANDVKLNPGA